MASLLSSPVGVGVIVGVEVAVASGSGIGTVLNYSFTSYQTSHSNASSAFSLLVYLAGIDGDFQRP